MRIRLKPHDPSDHAAAPLRFVALAAVVLLAAIELSAQSYQGSLRGRVTDAQDAVIPGALVMLTEDGTNLERTTMSNAEGIYVFPNLNPSTFTLTAEAPGFRKFERLDVIVETQASLTIDVAMELGDLTQTITVTESVPLIEDADASQGTMLDRQKLVDLPNSGRNPFMMSMITPGVTPVGNPRFNRMQDQSGSSQISIAGGPVRGNNYLLDGVPITDSQNRAVIIPSIESVQEVKIQSNTYDAEMGRTGGGTFNTVLKSGTNQIHGSIFGMMRTTTLTANNFFNNAAGTERPDTPYKNYGGSFGGPVVIPKAYNGRNKTFLWLSAEGYRQTSAEVQRYAVPTSIERVGDFSQSFSDGALQTIYDPLSTAVDASGNYVRTPFAGNVIPSDRLNTVGVNVASYYPAPNVNVAEYGASNLISEAILNDKADQYTAKIDQELAPWWRMNVSYLHYGSREPGAPHFGPPASPNGSLLYRKVDSTQVNSTMTVTPTTVLTLRYGFNRFPNESTNLATTNGFSATELGFPANFVAARQLDGFPAFTMSNFANLGRARANDTRFYSRNLVANVAKYMGIHNLKWGLDFRRIHQDFQDFGAGIGSFSINEDFTRSAPGAADGTGSDMASLLLGYPDSGDIELTTALATYVNYYAGYVQDDIRISPTFTLNLGLRYEYETGLREENNNFTVDFDRNVINPISTDDYIAYGGLLYAGIDGAPTEQGSTSARKFAPRVGIAWSVTPKTVVRGGYGLFWSPVRIDSNVGAVGYEQVTTYVASNDGGRTPANSLSNPYPNGLLEPVGNSLGLLGGIGSDIEFVNPDRRGGLVQQFSFDIQREMPGNIALTLAYIGSRSSRMPYGSTSSGGYNINQLFPGYFSMGSALTAPVDNPFYGNGGIGLIGAPTVALNQLLRPYAAFGDVTLVQGDGATAKYDSLVVRAQKRMAQGLTFLTAFTWSKSFDNSWGATNTLSDASRAGPQNAYDLDAEYTQSLHNAPLRFTGSFTYELPFGDNKPFLNSGIGSWVAGGWQLNTVMTLQSGFPLAIRQNSNNNSVIGASLQRPNATGVSPETEGSLGQRLDNYINPDAFEVASRYSFGNLTRTIGMRGPGIANFDISLFKAVPIGEQFNAQFRAEAINAFNTPQFRGPEIRVGNSRFGTISRQANFPRVVQLGLRLFW